MKEFFAKTLMNNSLENWVYAILFVVGGIALGKFLAWFMEKVLKQLTQKTKSDFDDIIVEAVKKPLVFFVTIMGFWYAIEYLNFPNEKVDIFLHKMHLFMVVMNITWLISRVMNMLLEAYFFPYAKRDDTSFDAQLLPVLKKGFTFFIWGIGVVLGLDNLDFDIGAMLAGMGIGGLALALAAQDIVKNIFGGIMIFLDKPFKIGERIMITTYDGTVERVGLRSTRVRTLDGRLVTIPNSQFNDNAITNIVSEPTRRIILDLGLTYDTPPEKMEEAGQILRQIVVDKKDVLTQEPVVSFLTFGEFNLNIRFAYFILQGNDYFQVQNDVNMEILKRFNTSGLEFAFPTRTIYTKQG
jgi:MscS family membrane protein